MSTYRFIILAALLLATCKSNAQNGIVELGAKASGMGNTYSALRGSWSAFNNPAGLSAVDTQTALFSAENKFGIRGLSTLGTGIILPLKVGTTSVTAFRFGDDLFHQQNISLAYANEFGIGQLGLRASYHETYVEGFGSKALLTIDFGGVVSLGEQLSFGAFIRNINRAKLSDFEDERLPTILNAGISYKSSEKLTLNVDIQKDIEFDPRFKLGLEYQFLPKFSFRTGLNTAPFINSFGLGLNTWKVIIDYALNVDYILGNSHQVSLNYKLSKN